MYSDSYFDYFDWVKLSEKESHNLAEANKLISLASEYFRSINKKVVVMGVDVVTEEDLQLNYKEK